MLLGETPFNTMNIIHLYNKILNDKVVFPNDFDENAKDLITKLLH